MSFESDYTRRNAKSTLDKLLGKVVPGMEESTQQRGSTKQAAAQKVDQSLRRGINDPQEMRKLQDKARSRRNKNISKSLEEAKKLNKVVKYNMIKNHKKEGRASEEEAKYLRKLVKKNANLAARLSDIDDDGIKSELQEVQREILAITNENTAKRSRRRKEKKNNDFKTKLEKGIISYPGLTPGLAPIDLEDESE